MNKNITKTSFRSQPAIKIEIEKDKVRDEPTDLHIAIESEMLESEPLLKVVNEQTLEEYSIPYIVALYLNDELFSMPKIFLDTQREFETSISDKRKALHDPLEMNKGLVQWNSEVVFKNGSFQLKSFKGANSNTGLVLKKDQANLGLKPYIPFLVWHEEPTDYMAKGTHGWKLYLTGFAEGAIGFANWNDGEGIIKLIDSMSDVESLKVIASLTYPDMANVTSVLSLSEELLDSLKSSSDMQGREDIIALFEKSPTLEYPKEESSIDNVKIRALILADKQIAYGISIPFSPVFKKPAELKEPEPYGLLGKYFAKQRKLEAERAALFARVARDDATKDAERRMAQQKWGETFFNEARAAGYMIVLPLGVTHPPLFGQYEYHSTIWITDLSESQWRQIFPATSVAVVQEDSDRGRSSVSP